MCTLTTPRHTQPYKGPVWRGLLSLYCYSHQNALYLFWEKNPTISLRHVVHVTFGGTVHGSGHYNLQHRLNRESDIFPPSHSWTGNTQFLHTYKEDYYRSTSLTVTDPWTLAMYVRGRGGRARGRVPMPEDISTSSSEGISRGGT